MKTVKYTYVSQKDYDTIKGLIGYGLTIKQIKEITKRGNSVVDLVKKTKNFGEYKAERNAISAKYKNKAEQPAQHGMKFESLESEPAQPAGLATKQDVARLETMIASLADGVAKLSTVMAELFEMPQEDKANHKLFKWGAKGNRND